ncbi:hypothetical protein [Mesorhizobium sp. M1216]|uniref:hypothetical protein n=1 Tax=Mesorhizobium sp. M1216 TaxID=2957069 RepID=UPI003339CDB0
MQRIIGSETQRILGEAGYRGHNAPQSHKFRIFTAGQKRRSAVEPVIGPIKNGPQLPRSHPSRCDQRHPGRSRLQLLPPAQVAEGVLVALDRRVPDPAEAACRLAIKIVNGRRLHDNRPFSAGVAERP